MQNLSSVQSLSHFVLRQVDVQTTGLSSNEDMMPLIKEHSTDAHLLDVLARNGDILSIQAHITGAPSWFHLRELADDVASGEVLAGEELGGSLKIRWQSVKKQAEKPLAGTILALTYSAGKIVEAAHEARPHPNCFVPFQTICV